MTENVREGGSKAMGVETGTVGPEGSERLTSGPEATEEFLIHEGVISKAALDTIVRLTRERDEAREECGFEKGMRKGLRDELGIFIDLRAKALALVAERDSTIERLTYDRNHPYGGSGIGANPESILWNGPVQPHRGGGYEPAPISTTTPSLNEATNVPLVMHEPGCSLDTDHKGSCVLGERIEGHAHSIGEVDRVMGRDPLTIDELLDPLTLPARIKTHLAWELHTQYCVNKTGTCCGPLPRDYADAGYQITAQKNEPALVDECPCSRCAHYRDVAASIAAKAKP